MSNSTSIVLEKPGYQNSLIRICTCHLLNFHAAYIMFMTGSDPDQTGWMHTRTGWSGLLWLHVIVGFC